MAQSQNTDGREALMQRAKTLLEVAVQSLQPTDTPYSVALSLTTTRPGGAVTTECWETLTDPNSEVTRRTAPSIGDPATWL